MSQYATSYILSKLHTAPDVLYNHYTAGSDFILKELNNMVSSKELLEVLCLLSTLPTNEKADLLRHLRAQRDNVGSLQPPASSQEKVAE